MYRKPEPEPLPYQRNFRVLLKQGYLLISTTRLLVTIHHFTKTHGEPDYTMHFLVDDNPELPSLFHPVFGWDFIGLINFLWRKIDTLKTLDLRNVDLKKELGIETVSIPSQNNPKQEKRSTEQSIQMICDFVLDNPNCTRLEISRHLGRAKNPFVLGQIEWLVLHGKLARTTNVRPNGVIEYRYIFVGDN